MKNKIKCIDCWYHVERTWRDDKSWCRIYESLIPKNHEKTRCKHFESIESVTKK